MSDIIKATARFQEADEPIKQKPIIHIERPLPNTIRASIDSGRDNPFKPDGKIYKSADPIVDYYKYGPNQSRAQSPADNQLLLSGALNSDETKLSKKERKRREKQAKKEAAKAAGGDERKPCWRRWLCCCCCCSCRSKSGEGNDGPEKGRIGAGAQFGAVDNEAVGKTKDSKQTKVVVLRDDSDSQTNGPKITVSSTGGGSSNSELSMINQSAGNPAEKIVIGQQTKASTEAKQRASQRSCVIS